MTYTIYASEVRNVNPQFQAWQWPLLNWFDRCDIAKKVFSNRGDRQTAYLFATRNSNVFENITLVNDIVS